MWKSRQFLWSVAMVALLCLQLSYPSLAWARGEEEPPPEVDNYIFSYFLTFLGVALGLVSVCMSAGRRDDIKVSLD